MIRKFVTALVLPDETMWYITGNNYANRIVLTNDIKGATKFLTVSKADFAGRILRDSMDKEGQDKCRFFVIPYGKTPGEQYEIKKDIVTEVSNELYNKLAALKEAQND